MLRLHGIWNSDRQHPHTKLPYRRMHNTIAAQGSIAQCGHRLRHSSAQYLQTLASLCGKAEHLLGGILGNAVVVFHCWQKSLPAQIVADSGKAQVCFLCTAFLTQKLLHILLQLLFAFLQKIKTKQAVHIIIACSQKLSLRDILKGCGDSAFHLHILTVDDMGVILARQCGAIASQQKYRLLHTALSLLDSKCGKRGIVQTAFTHYLIHQKPHALFDLLSTGTGPLPDPFIC